jgi:hypothetical protein
LADSITAFARDNSACNWIFTWVVAAKVSALRPANLEHAPAHGDGAALQIMFQPAAAPMEF